MPLHRAIGSFHLPSHPSSLISFWNTLLGRYVLGFEHSSKPQRHWSQTALMWACAPSQLDGNLWRCEVVPLIDYCSTIVCRTGSTFTNLHHVYLAGAWEATLEQNKLSVFLPLLHRESKMLLHRKAKWDYSREAVGDLLAFLQGPYLYGLLRQN